jgi:hypothetical protein
VGPINMVVVEVEHSGDLSRKKKNSFSKKKKRKRILLSLKISVFVVDVYESNI